MKSLLCGVLLAFGAMFAAAAPASELVQLTQPALTGIGQPARTACVGYNFNTDDSIVGACRTATVSGCSGRGCQPTTLTTDYIATWDSAGNATGVQACSVVRHHLPQADQTTYLNGHTSLDCHNVIFSIGTVVEIDGVPFYYRTTSADGSELVNSNAAGYVFLP